MEVSSKIKDTVNEDGEQINGNNYIEVAKDYYDSTMYSEGTQIVDNIFSNVFPVFNAVPKVVNIATALSIGGDVETFGDNKESVDEFLKDNKFNETKGYIARDLVLGKSTLLKLEINEDDGKWMFSNFTSDNYTIISMDGRIIHAIISGFKYEFENSEFKKVVMNEIFVDDGEKCFSYFTDEDGESVGEQTEYAYGKLPLVEIVTAYDLKQLFYSVDRYNEIDSYIISIFGVAGEPIITGTGLDKLTKESSEQMKEDRYKNQKFLFTKNENAMIKSVELQGTSATVMQNKQNEIVQNIIKDYPEYSISDVLSGSNVSEETTKIRLTEVLSRVNELRLSLENGFNDLIRLFLFFNNIDEEKKCLNLGNMIDINVGDMIENVLKANTGGIISKESSMNLIKGMYISKNVEEEMLLIEKEEEEKEEFAEELEPGMEVLPGEEGKVDEIPEEINEDEVVEEIE